MAELFIDSLGSGDTETALAQLGPRSVAYIQALGGDPLGFVSEMQEGYGAWAGSPDVAISAASAGVVAPLTSELAIVTVQGTYPGEGEAEDRVDAFPMVREGDRWMVELVAFAGGNLAAAGVVPAALAGWSPNLVLTLVVVPGLATAACGLALL